MKCPECNHTFVGPDSYSIEQNGDTYINYVGVYCPKCRKWFKWTETFPLSGITSPEEMKGEE